MCLLCTQLWIEDHWTEVAAGTGPGGDPAGVVSLEVHVARRGQRLRDRARRTRLVGIVLAGQGLTLQDWEGSSYVLRDRKGNSAVVHDLAHVWEAAETMTGVSLDPLDPALLDRLTRSREIP